MMFIQRKVYLSKIARIRVAEGRNLDKGLRLDRNEKVDVWPKQMLSEIFAAQPQYFLSVYPESTRLYHKLARFHDVTESQLLLTSGIDGGLKTVFEIMTEPGDLVGVVSPTYAMYQVYPRLFQLQLEEIVCTADFQFNRAQFETFLERRPTVFFLPNPNQPIETCFGLAQLEEMAQKTLVKNCLFVIDEAYHMFGSESGIDLIRKYPNIVVARTFSKGFGVPSIRLGYLVSNEDNMSILSKTRFAHESNALSNAVAEHLLDNYEMVQRYNQEVIAAREKIKALLDPLGIRARGENGNFLLLDLRDAAHAKNYVAALRAQNIYVKGPWSAPWDRYVTITLGPTQVMEPFLAATRAFCRESSS
jgi:histidinol-phosphate aminotransferase